MSSDMIKAIPRASTTYLYLCIYFQVVVIRVIISKLPVKQSWQLHHDHSRNYCYYHRVKVKLEDHSQVQNYYGTVSGRRAEPKINKYLSYDMTSVLLGNYCKNPDTNRYVAKS